MKARSEFKSPAPTLQSQAWLYMPVTPALEDEDRWILGVGWLDHSAKIMSFRLGDNLSQKSKVEDNKGRLHTQIWLLHVHIRASTPKHTHAHIAAHMHTCMNTQRF